MSRRCGGWCGSALALGAEAIDALLPLLARRASLPPTDGVDRAFWR
ncbi:MAG: hypothetical protein U0232_24245 [Thermomicrobiales bacterium]